MRSTPPFARHLLSKYSLFSLQIERLEIRVEICSPMTKRKIRVEICSSMTNINNENITNRVNPHLHKIFTYKHTGFSELKTVEEAAMFHKNTTDTPNKILNLCHKIQTTNQVPSPMVGISVSMVVVV